MRITRTFGRGYFSRTAPDAKTNNTAKILIGNQAFQREVAQLRSKWSKTEYRTILDAELVKEQARVVRMRKYNPRYRIPASLHRPPHRSVFYLDILTLMQHFKLRKKLWINFLWRYINAGKYEMADVPSETAPLVHLAQDEETGETRMLIEIGENTTINEIKEAWRMVEGLRRRFFPNRKKYKPWKNFDRDSKVYSLYEHGLTITEISSRIFKEDGIDLDYGNIKKIVTAYRKKLGLLKSGKLITSRIKRLR